MIKYQVFKASIYLSLFLTVVSCGAKTEKIKDNQPLNSPEQDTFSFHLLKQTDVTFKALHNQTPLSGVKVSILGADKEKINHQKLLWTGYSNTEGVLSACISTFLDQENIELFINKTGYYGPYDDEELRSQHIEFSPSARYKISLSKLDGHTINLNNNLLSPDLQQTNIPNSTSLKNTFLTPLFSTSDISQREYIDSFVDVPNSVMNIVGDLLPETGAVAPYYLSDTFDVNLLVTDEATVSITFLHEGAGYKNSMGYFTYITNGSQIEIIDSQLIFPNASYGDSNQGWGGGELETGDTVTLRDAEGNIRIFETDQNIGFFVVANGWDGSSVKGWTAEDPNLPYDLGSQNASVSKGVFTSIDAINPEYSNGNADLARHFIVIKIEGAVNFLNGEDFYVIGAEDLRRDWSSDDDFNDLVFLVQSTPEQALSQSYTATYNVNDADADNDGVEGTDDAFPNDPDRAFLIRTPPTNYQTIAFEDQYPSTGDSDYNDVVIQYAFDEVNNADGLIKDLSGTFHLIARGAGLNHSFGIAIHGIPENITGTIKIQRFTTTDEKIDDDIINLQDLVKLNKDGSKSIRISGLFKNTKQDLPPEEGAFSNTQFLEATIPPASVRFIISFDSPLSRALLGSIPFDPFIQVVREGGLYDIHRPGQPAFLDRPSHLPSEDGDYTFIDENNYPWVLIVPYDWRYPIESIHIGGNDGAYGNFHTWRASFGLESPNWYTSPIIDNSSHRVINPISNAVRVRSWDLHVGN